MDLFRKKVYCRFCERRTNHGIIFNHEISGRVPDDDFNWDDKYYIVKCLGCDTVAFVKEYFDETMIFYDPEFNEHIELEDITVYPEEPLKKKDKISRETKHYSNLPEVLEMLYKQTLSAFDDKSYLLTSIGLRMIIEGVCNDLGINSGPVIDFDTNTKKVDDSGKEIKTKSLTGKINGLIDKSIIVSKQAQILHQIRVLGNQSAHDLEIPTRRAVRLAIEITENILYNIYELDKYRIIKSES